MEPLTAYHLVVNRISSATNVSKKQKNEIIKLKINHAQNVGKVLIDTLRPFRVVFLTISPWAKQIQNVHVFFYFPE